MECKNSQVQDQSPMISFYNSPALKYVQFEDLFVISIVPIVIFRTKYNIQSLLEPLSWGQSEIDEQTITRTMNKQVRRYGNLDSTGVA